MTSSPKFPLVATALLVSGGLLLNFLFPLIAHATATIQLVSYAVASSVLLGGGFLAMRHYWVYDKPMFKRKVVLLALSIIVFGCSYAFLTHQVANPSSSVHH